jgi:membrane-associated phospholipid phosphatase
MFSQIDAVDHHFTPYVFSLHTTFFDNFFLFITQIGNAASVIIITGSLLSWFWLKKRPYYFYLLLTTVSGSALTAQILKVLVARPRPELALYPLDSFSFPSGHATSAMALYGVIAYILLWGSERSPYRYLGLFLCGLAISLVGFSRIYLGFHYLTDVLAGYVIGALWLWVTVWVLKRNHFPVS